MKTRVFLIIIVATSLVVSCTDKSDVESPEVEIVELSTSTKAIIAEKANSFGIKLFQQIIESESSDNTFISPLSCAMAMSMTSLGASGETYDEIVSTLGFVGMEKSELGSYFYDLSQSFASADQSVTFESANSIWVNKTLKIQADFENAAAKYFDAAARNVDFSSAKTAAFINGWICDHTHGLIKDMVARTDGWNVALVNALYFNSAWKEKVTKGKISFTGSDGKTSTQDAICAKSFRYSQNEAMQYVSMPFGSTGRYECEILIPVGQNSVKSMDLTKIGECREKAVEASGNVSFIMPFIEVTHSTNLKDLLEKMGIHRAFTEEAQFEGISKNLYISSVLQKSHITLNDKGAEAASATIVVMDGATAEPIERNVIKADRPFVFLIREKASGTVLFIGQKAM